MTEITQRRIILGSGSPRRKELLYQLGLDFEVIVKEVDETFPDNMLASNVPVFLAQKKCKEFSCVQGELVITADTIVICEETILGKPKGDEEAYSMLRKLSGKMHQVITGVCLQSFEKTHYFSDETVVYFSELSDTDIWYYIQNFKPFDKAGGYGIQDWIGLRTINRIEGSYTNVVGLPTQKLYQCIINYFPEYCTVASFK